MNFGVTILKGARPWQIFQQEKGKAAISLDGEYRLIHLSGEPPFSFDEVIAGKVSIKARIAFEETGESVIPWQQCEILDGKRWKVIFNSVPAGGLYRIETYMDYEGWDGLSVTRGDMIHHVGVGDIFVLAGQSNAAGRAKSPFKDEPELGVHLLRNNGNWDLATHPLNETTGSVYLTHFENHNPGHSPYLHFAKRLKKELGYPVGLVICALGGAPLRWWNPKEQGSLFDNMVQILNDNAIKPKAVLWYQGEADGFEKTGDTYLERFVDFVKATRDALDQPDLPFITVQLNRCMRPSEEDLDPDWGKVREAQRRAPYMIKNVFVIPANDIGLYDFVHNSPEGDLVIGERCAAAALSELYGKMRHWHAPEAVKATKMSEEKVVIELSPIMNWVNLYEVPPELLPFNVEDEEGLAYVASYQQEENKIILTLNRSIKGKSFIHGAWKMNPGPVIPCDCMRLPMLSFYGLEIE